MEEIDVFVVMYISDVPHGVNLPVWVAKSREEAEAKMKTLKVVKERLTLEEYNKTPKSEEVPYPDYLHECDQEDLLNVGYHYDIYKTKMVS